MNNLYILYARRGAGLAPDVVNAQLRVVAGSALCQRTSLRRINCRRVGRLAVAAVLAGVPAAPASAGARVGRIGGLAGAGIAARGPAGRRLRAAMLSAAGILGTISASILIDHTGGRDTLNRISAARVIGVLCGRGVVLSWSRIEGAMDNADPQLITDLRLSCCTCQDADDWDVGIERGRRTTGTRSSRRSTDPQFAWRRRSRS